MTQEIFACHITKSGSPVAFIVGVGTVVGHELRIILVIHTPGVGVVHKGVGGLCGSDAAHGTSVLSVGGTAHKGFDEAFRVVVKGTRLAVDGVDEGHFANVVHLCHIAGAEIGFAPTLVVAVVTVLEQHTSVVDGLHHLTTRSSSPAAEFAWSGRDVTHSVRSEIVDDHIGVLVARPLVARIALVNGVNAHGVLALVAPIATDHFGADLEPALGLPTQSGDGLVVGGRFHVGVGEFVFELLANHHLGFVGVGCNQTREGHLWHHIAVDVGVGVVSDAIAIT